MKTLALILFLVVSPGLYAMQVKDDPIAVAVDSLATRLLEVYTVRTNTHIALLEFRTKADQLSELNYRLVTELSKRLRLNPKIELIPQNRISFLLEDLKWSLTAASSFKVYNEMNEKIFELTGQIADAFLYGIVEKCGAYTTITLHLLPGGIASNELVVQVRF